jgi:gamma-butyrobetaine dioxygenase
MAAAFYEIETGPTGRPLPRGSVRAVRVDISGEIDVVFDGGSVRLHADWLRDNCRCAECRIQQTDERRFQPWVESSPAVVQRTEIEDGALVVHWASGHVSTFTRGDWDDIDRAMCRGRVSTRFWKHGHAIERFDHDLAIADLAVRRSLFEAFRRDGVVVVSDAPCAPGSVIEFLRAIGITVRDSSLGLIFDVTVDPAGYNVAYTAESVPPHNDNAQYEHPPSGQVLAMLVNDVAGGDSIVVDG